MYTMKKIIPEVAKVTDIIMPSMNSRKPLPLFLESVSAGFPSPADDYMDKTLDLNEYLIINPSATFFVRVRGESMIDAGIHNGDLLIVDRALSPKDGSIVIAVIDGELLVKRMSFKKNKVFLILENREYMPVEIKPEMNFEVWGVVTTVIHSVKYI